MRIAYGFRLGPRYMFERGVTTSKGPRYEEELRFEGNRVKSVQLTVYDEGNVIVFKKCTYPAGNVNEIDFIYKEARHNIMLSDYMDLHDTDVIDDVIDLTDTIPDIDENTTALEILPAMGSAIYVISIIPHDANSAQFKSILDTYTLVEKAGDHNKGEYVYMSDNIVDIMRVEKAIIDANCTEKLFRDTYLKYNKKCPSCNSELYGDHSNRVCTCGADYLPCDICSEYEINTKGFCDICKFKHDDILEV